ncbi:MAG: tRNA(His) guanylyltransferase Thg1 family protein [Promethearchaeota archaeon]
MKKLEKTTSYQLPQNLPVIMRVDGRAFHTFTKDMKKPFDPGLIRMMDAVGVALCEEITGARLAYL